MRKSPLSAPGGSNRGYYSPRNQYNYGGYNNKPRNDYQYSPSSYSTPNLQNSDDFIPFGKTSPNSLSCNNTRTNYRRTSHNNSSFRQRRSFNQYPPKKVDISEYVDLRSFLEDPWSDLMNRHDVSQKLDSLDDTQDYVSNSSQDSSSLDHGKDSQSSSKLINDDEESKQ